VQRYAGHDAIQIDSPRKPISPLRNHSCTQDMDHVGLHLSTHLQGLESQDQGPQMFIGGVPFVETSLGGGAIHEYECHRDPE